MKNLPYHEGELSVQAALGESYAASRTGRVIGNEIPSGALGFISQQVIVAATVIDASGAPWTEVLAGESGFVSADPARVHIDLTRGGSVFGARWLGQLARNSRVGLLFIELATRRRLRVNGRASREGELVSVYVEEAYPNCPKFIQRRHPSIDGKPGGSSQLLGSGTALGDDERDLIARTDTIFVGSYHPSGLPDASHRGGQPGFVKVEGAAAIRVPDYTGNSMYNTLGNFHANPQGAVTAVDFESGRLLQMTGNVTLHLQEASDPPIARSWGFSVDEWRLSRFPSSLQWEFLDASPYNPQVHPRQQELNTGGAVGRSRDRGQKQEG